MPISQTVLAPRSYAMFLPCGLVEADFWNLSYRTVNHPAKCVDLNRNDKWDQVIGACYAGAFLNRAKGPSGMVQGAASYGLFSLVIALQMKGDGLNVVDVPLDMPTKKR